MEKLIDGEVVISSTCEDAPYDGKYFSIYTNTTGYSITSVFGWRTGGFHTGLDYVGYWKGAPQKDTSANDSKKAYENSKMYLNAICNGEVIHCHNVDQYNDPYDNGTGTSAHRGGYIKLKLDTNYISIEPNDVSKEPNTNYFVCNDYRVYYNKNGTGTSGKFPIYVIYQHLYSRCVNVADKVKRGEAIAKEGHTGECRSSTTDGRHLHIEFQFFDNKNTWGSTAALNGIKINPIAIASALGLKAGKSWASTSFTQTVFPDGKTEDPIPPDEIPSPDIEQPDSAKHEDATDYDEEYLEFIANRDSNLLLYEPIHDDLTSPPFMNTNVYNIAINKKEIVDKLVKRY